MIEIDYTILEGLATPVEIDDEWLHLHRDDSYVGIPKNIIISIRDEENTVRIETKGSVISLWKKVNLFHVTIL